MKSQNLFSLKNKKKIKMSSAAVVIGTLRVKMSILISVFFLFLNKNLCSGNSFIQVPQGGTSNEYPQHKFHREKNNITINFWTKCLIRSYVK